MTLFRRPLDLTALTTTMNQILSQVMILQGKADAIMSDQSHLNADVAAISAQVAAINSAVTSVAAEIAALKTVPAGTPLDFTAADKAVADLTAAAGGVAALEPPAAPPAAPVA